MIVGWGIGWRREVYLLRDGGACIVARQTGETDVKKALYLSTGHVVSAAASLAVAMAT